MNTNISNSSDAKTLKPNDILVSRTDERGVILAANETFQRISGYSHDELIGAPHKIVRHPDMPKAAFFLIWEALQNSKPIGAIVKNQIKDGGHYWVFAFLAPQPGGYVSCRVKPSPETIALIEREYEAACAYEQSADVTPEQSAEALLKRIADLGYYRYDCFIADVAISQAKFRAASLQTPVDERVEFLSTLKVLWASVRSDCDTMLEAQLRISHTPTNLRVQAAHLNERGIPLGVIATNFTVLAAEIDEMMASFMDQSEQVDQRLSTAAFLVSREYFMGEAANSIAEEVQGDGHMDQAMADDMLVELGTNVTQTLEALTDASQQVKAFGAVLDETTRVLSGLSVAKVMCEIENAYVGPDRNSGVTDIISELDRFQKEARDCIFSIRRHLMRIEQIMKRLLAEEATSAAA